MDSFSTKVRTFDAFPKIDPHKTQRSSSGGFSTLVTALFILLVTWVEIGGFLGGYVDHQFIVDDKLTSDLFINLDMLVAMPCEYMHTNVMDVTHDRLLAGELLNFQGMNFFVPDIVQMDSENNDHNTPDLDEVMRETVRAEFNVAGTRMNEDASACHIYGSIPVNKVAGDFHITGKGFGYADRHRVPFEKLNFSHVIMEFSFGEFYPMIKNPLDFTGKISSQKLQSYKYFMTAVPTLYEKLGIEVDTYQYSLTEQHRAITTDETGLPSDIPGLYFKYDFDTIKLLIAEKRIPFLQFVARLATIVSGLFIVATYLYKLYSKTITLIFGKKFAYKDTEKLDGGLLGL